jgi:peptidoglycan/xylan/chitin deacetylase (PgdA/CDA1 family)
LVKTPKLVQRSLSERVWAFPNKTNEVYLTFDDGPIPEVTPWVLDTLASFNAKATFFCIGDNIKKHPTVFKKVLKEGHTIGNHTQHHLNGRKTSTKVYLKDVEKCASLIESELFRPPYGRVSSKQVRKLKKKGYTIVMWDVLSGDFDKKISVEKCCQNVIQHIEPGSIVVFHDSLKAEKNLKYALPKVLEYITAQGWSCSSS